MASYVYVKNPNGTTYVYQNESYWDKAEQKTKHHRKCIGKLHPETNEIIPNRKKSITTDPNGSKTEHCTVLTTGPALLLDKAVHETGIDKTLRTSFPEDWDRILTCAYYLASKGTSLCHVEQWPARNRHPFHSKLADQSYNRDGENLPQVNLLMVTSEETHLPIYYRILSGSIKDVTTINESLASFKFLGARSVHLVMDKGFYSEPNIDALYGSHYRFSVGVPFTASIATDAVEENRMGMDSQSGYETPENSFEYRYRGPYIHSVCCADINHISEGNYGKARLGS